MMERRFSMNDFERSLKEHADEFKMVPSKKVWHGIYNDMHPGRRWPSIAMSLLLIFTLVVIGHLNTHNGAQIVNAKNKALAQVNLVDQLNRDDLPQTAQKVTRQNKSTDNSHFGTDDVLPPAFINTHNSVNSNTNYRPDEYNLNNNLPEQNSQPGTQSGVTTFKKNSIFYPELASNANDFINSIFGINDNSETGTTLIGNSIEVVSAQLNQKVSGSIITGNSLDLKFPQQIIAEKNNALEYAGLENDNNKNVLSKNKQGKLTKNAVYAKRKISDKKSWTYFVTPQINSVSFSGKPITPITTNSNPIVTVNQKNYKVLHNPAFGFGAGIQMNYLFTKKLAFTSGLDISYSGYNIISNEVHPTFSTLLLRNSETRENYSKSYVTHYGDGTGPSSISLKNYSLQVSIPVGLQYQVSGNDKVQFNTYTNFAPSIIIKSNAFILSSDGNNYVNDLDLLRKFNVSSNFGLFVSFTSAKFKWQFGPNIRYQWLSTYKKDYTIHEHLIDYGIRIGISPLRK